MCSTCSEYEPQYNDAGYNTSRTVRHLRLFNSENVCRCAFMHGWNWLWPLCVFQCVRVWTLRQQDGGDKPICPTLSHGADFSQHLFLSITDDNLPRCSRTSCLFPHSWVEQSHLWHSENSYLQCTSICLVMLKRPCFPYEQGRYWEDRAAAKIGNPWTVLHKYA